MKLEVLCERGVDGERAAAERKLKRLLARYDWQAKTQDLRDLFKGVFIAAQGEAHPVLMDTAIDVASFVKWAIEERCSIPCVYRNGSLCAAATPKTARQLERIAKTVAQAFEKLWAQFRTEAKGNPADRHLFLLGLYEGMMNETRENQPLPSRFTDRHAPKARRGSLGRARGVTVHPYSIGTQLGANLRMETPLPELSQQLNHTIKGELKA